MYPREAMPTAAQWIGNAIPLTYFLRILRGVLLKGSGLQAIWPDVLALSAFAIVLVTVRAMRFRKSLD
jgi:ABC-2 type transport system permease protein